MRTIEEIANKFIVESKIVKAEKYGCGHINDTYRVTDENGKYYVLQRINHNIFKDVEGLMRNIEGVTEHIYRRLQAEGGDTANALRVIKTVDGKSLFEDDGNYFRMYNFVYGGVSIESRATQEQFYLSAVGFGTFQKMLDGYPAENLVDTIPEFHNTVRRFDNFCRAVAEDKVGRLASVRAEVQFYLDREDYCPKIVDLLGSGRMPLRVTHNDTKLNNVLINVEEKKPVTVIDLDTVMKGSILYDFGDSIRFGATTAAEDEKDLSKVEFSIDLFEAYVKGFIGEVGSRMTNIEVELLAFGAILMTYECGMRFLTDYLEGDTYFKVHREGHNLDRTRTQMKLVSDMESALPEMNEIVKKYAAK